MLEHLKAQQPKYYFNLNITIFPVHLQIPEKSSMKNVRSRAIACSNFTYNRVAVL